MSPETSELENELDRDYQEWQKRVRGLESVIARNGRRDLDVLEAEGVDRKTLLRLLALAPSLDSSLIGLMRQRQAALKSLAGRLETLARETKERTNDPLSVVQFWSYTLGGWGVLGMTFPEPMSDDPGIALITSGMTVLARRMKDQAKRFGRYLKAYGRADVGVVLLLVRYRMFRPKMDHLNELARLLTDAFEAAGAAKAFSADGLRKTYQRHGKRYLRLWLHFNTPAAPTTAGPLPAALPIGRPISNE